MGELASGTPVGVGVGGRGVAGAAAAASRRVSDTRV